MISILFSFIGSQIFYQIFVVIFWFWLQIIPPEKIAIMRDWIWIVICSLFFLLHIKFWKTYFSQRIKMRIWVIFLIWFTSLFSWFIFDKNITDILIGIKYGFRYFIILLWSIGIGFFLEKENNRSEKRVINWLNLVKWGLVFTVVIGRIWQFLKLLKPEWFYHIGYWGLDDFHFGVNPPIYYLTGFKWSLRRQGLFSWPNNYAYFLVVFLPLLWQLFSIDNIFSKKKREKAEWISFIIIILWIITLGATLSRAGLIWGALAIILVNFNKLIKHKKILIWWISALIISVIGLSIWKWDSTRVHIEKKFWGISSVIEHPLWVWLGSSWPAIHHWWTQLPENYYLQLMIDMGTIGFLLWCAVMGIFFQEQKQIKEKVKKEDQIHQKLLNVLNALQQGLLALMVMWLFLHVFEDSMVNYIFFSLYWLTIGYLNSLIKNSKKNE